MTAEAPALVAPTAAVERATRLRRVTAPLWSAALMLVLAFLVLYPMAMLLLGALTNTNPVVDGFGVFDLSLANFVRVLANPNVHDAVLNSLIACTGGTALAVGIGLAFSWIVVRTNTPGRRFIGGASLIPLFVPPLVAGVAWSILGSPKSGLINVALKWAGLDWRVDLYSMAGLIMVFGMYYAPYVYMFTASALRNMDPSLEEAAEISGAGPLRALFTVTGAGDAVRHRRAENRRQSQCRQAVPELVPVGRRADLHDQGARRPHFAQESSGLSRRVRSQGREGVAAELRAVREAARELGRGVEQGLRPSAVAEPGFRFACSPHGTRGMRGRPAERRDPDFASLHPGYDVARKECGATGDGMSASLSVSALRKQFSIGRPAVDGVTFQVGAGEIVVLLGPSGCGKTTTLRCVAGLERPSAGHISIGARLVSAPAEGVQVPPRLRNIGMVFQSYAVWPHMTVRQNVDGVMRDGKLLQMAAADEIYNRPADLFVARFTGASNRLTGCVRERNGEFATIAARSGERLTTWLPDGVMTGAAVEIALRPENVRITADGAGEPNRFPAQVCGRRYQGTQTVYELNVLGGRLEAVELGTSSRHAVGSEVTVVLPPQLCWAYPSGPGVELE